MIFVSSFFLIGSLVFLPSFYERFDNAGQGTPRSSLLHLFGNATVYVIYIFTQHGIINDQNISYIFKFLGNRYFNWRNTPQFKFKKLSALQTVYFEYAVYFEEEEKSGLNRRFYLVFSENLSSFKRSPYPFLHQIYHQ